MAAVVLTLAFVVVIAWGGADDVVDGLRTEETVPQYLGTVPNVGIPDGFNGYGGRDEGFVIALPADYLPVVTSGAAGAGDNPIGGPPSTDGLRTGISSGAVAAAIAPDDDLVFRATVGGGAADTPAVSVRRSLRGQFDTVEDLSVDLPTALSANGATILAFEQRPHPAGELLVIEYVMPNDGRPVTTLQWILLLEGEVMVGRWSFPSAPTTIERTHVDETIASFVPADR